MTDEPIASDAARRAQVPLTDRVNVEPAILHGMTSNEATWIGLASMIVYSLVTGLLVAITGLWQLLLVALVGTIITLWYASLRLQTMKRDRPDGYYGHAIHLWMVKHGMQRARLLRHEGYWSLGRSLNLSFSSPLHPKPEAQPQPSTSHPTTS